jgi:hypothetical protein
MLEGILSGVGVATQPINLLMVMVGCFAGTFIGMLPGLGPISAIALMIPITYGFDPSTGLILMAGRLLRRNLRRLDLLDPDQRAGRRGHGRHLLRRLSDGQASRHGRQGAGDRRLFVLLRRHDRGDLPADRRPGAGSGVAVVPVDGLFRADGAGSDGRGGLCRQGQPRQGAADDGPRADAVDGRHRSGAGRAALHASACST